jgi:hypothetical protein
MDAEGYGFGAEDRGIDRLLGDFRTLSPAGIERAAWGWQLHVGRDGRDRFRDAERRAVEAIENHDLGSRWDEVRRSIYGLTEGEHRGVAWDAEETEDREGAHDAEHAAYGAALALMSASWIDDSTRRALMRPMAEAMPWLLPDEEPTPSRET